MESKKILKSFVNLKGKIGVFGGSFDPVHTGHIEAALEISNKLKLDLCVFIPAKQNPLKANAPLATDKERVEMLLAALKPYENLMVSLHEIESSRNPSYTVDTLHEIQSVVAPDAELFLLIGSDNLPTLHLWKDIGKINQMVTIVPYLRKGEECEVSPKLPFKLPELLRVNAIQISSTEIRQKMLAKEDLSAAIPSVVEEYIRERGLYSE